MFSSLFVCLCLLATLCKNSRSDLHEIYREVGNGSMKSLLNFGGDPDHRLDTGIVFRIRHWEIHDAAVLGRHRHSNNDVITSPVLGGGMRCLNASRVTDSDMIFIYKRIQNSAISSTAANRIVARLYT